MERTKLRINRSGKAHHILFILILPLGIYLGILIALIVLSVSWFKEPKAGAKVAGTFFAILALIFIAIPVYALVKG